MESNYQYVLEQWAKYNEFNFEQVKTKFNLADMSWEIDRDLRMVHTIVNNYDPSGALAVLFCKNTFLEYVENNKVPMINMFVDKKTQQKLEEARELWKLFNTGIVNDTEMRVIDSINQTGLVDISGKDIRYVSDHIYTVINQVEHLNIDMFKKGEPFTPIQKFLPAIFRFRSLADCLLNIESGADAMYLCYIEGPLMDGYFTYVLKQNGNIISINDRIDEPYKGAHQNSRTGRYADHKGWDLFPYNETVQFDERGYKGKETESYFTAPCYKLEQLENQSRLNLILGAILISNRLVYGNTDFEMKYVDSLVSINSNRLEQTTLPALIKNSGLVVAQQSLNIDITDNDIIDPQFGLQFNHNNKRDYKESGSFHNTNERMVELYKSDFKASDLIKSDILLLSNGEEAVAEPEFIGTKERIRLQAFYEGRKQLANHIKEQVYKELENFGGIEAVDSWFIDQIKKNKQQIFNRIVDSIPADIIDNIEDSGDYRYFTISENIAGRIYKDELYGDNNVLNSTQDGKVICPYYNCRCSFYIEVSPLNYLGLKEMLDLDNLPKVVDGWQKSREGDGNSILDATDKVAEVRTPFERFEQYRRDFEVLLAVSKKGLNEMKKRKYVTL